MCASRLGFRRLHFVTSASGIRFVSLHHISDAPSARNARWLDEANWRKRLDTEGLCFPGGREEDEDEKSAPLQRSDVPHSLARGLIVS